MDVYCSSSTGSNLNPGTQLLPVASLAAGYALLTTPSTDRLLLKCGDTWDESFPDWAKSGVSPTSRIVIGSYGTGARPLVRTGHASGIQIRALTGQDRRYITLSGIELWAHTHDGSFDCSGIAITAGGGVPADILVYDCYVHQYSNPFGCEGIETRAANITLRRSTFADALSTSAHALGLVVGQTDGLLVEDCTFIHNGWSETFPACVATLNQHSLYINPDNTTGVAVRGNIVALSSACAIRSSGALCENNLLLRNPINITVGPDTQIVRGNVCLDSMDINGDPRALGLDGTIGPDVQIYGNIFAHQTTGTGNAKAINLNGNLNGLRLHHNIVYNWVQAVNADAPALYLGNTSTADVQVYSNDFQQTGGMLIQRQSAVSSTIQVFSANRYYSNQASPFAEPSGNRTYAQWLAISGETGSSFGAVAYDHPERTIETYMASLGLTPTLDAFLTACRAQSEANYDPRFTSQAVIAYIRAGFAEGGTTFGGLSGSETVGIGVTIPTSGDPEFDFSWNLNVDMGRSFTANITRSMSFTVGV